MSKLPAEVLILGKLKDRGAKWSVGYDRTDERRVVTTVMIGEQDKFFIGTTVCSKHDQFKKAYGRMKALARAYSNLLRGNSVAPETNLWLANHVGSA